MGMNFYISEMEVAMDTRREVDKLKLELIMTKPFFGNVLYSLELKDDSDIKAVVESDGLYIKYNEKLIEESKLSVSRLRYAILHEMYRILLLHEYRREHRDSRIWSIACDMVIEHRLSAILEQEFGKLNPPPNYDPSRGLYLNKFIVFDEERFRRETEENIYRKLMKNYSENSGEIAYLDEVFSLNLKKSDLKSRRESSADTKRENAEMQKNRIKSIVAESVTKDRLAGSDSAEGSKILGRIEGKKINWLSILRRHLQVKTTEDTSFAYPDSRFQWNDMVIPDFEPREDFLDLLIVLDLSSSIEKREIDQMLFQIKNLSEQFSLNGRVIGFSTEVVLDKPLNTKEIARNIERYAFGGTDWNCVPKYVAEKRIGYGFAITITDGGFYTAPEDMHNHMWILTEGSVMRYRVINRVVEL